MFRSTEPMPTINNVFAGGRCTLQCPLGLSYDFIILKLTNCTPADLKNFKIKVGANSVWDLTSATYIADINEYYDRADDAGYLTIWFYRPEMKTETERAMFSLGTEDIQSLTLQWDLDAGVTSPAIEAWAMRRPQAPIGVITKLRQYPLSFATAGNQDIDNIPRGPRISAFHLYKADVSAVELKVNNGQGAGTPVDSPKMVLETIQKRHGRKPLTAKATHVDMNLLGKWDTPMVTAGLQDMRLKPVIDTSGALDVMVEYLDTLDGL